MSETVKREAEQPKINLLQENIYYFLVLVSPAKLSASLQVDMTGDMWTHSTATVPHFPSRRG